MQPLSSTSTGSLGATSASSLGASPIGRAALADQLPANARASLARALGVLAFELAQACAREALSVAAAQLTGVASALDAHVRALGAEPLRVDAAALEALLLAQRLRASAPAAARLGQVRLLHEATAALHFPACALAAPAHEQPWDDPAAQALARQASDEWLAGLARVVEAVGQLHEAGDGLLSLLNHEAGTHPMPCDVRELSAAIAASHASYGAVRYYEARYGERGLRFSRSDSCWLAATARSEPATAERHVLWLGRVLSNRGMPALLLERHLGVLHAELVAAVPERAHGYDALPAIAARLAATREAALPRSDASALAASFRNDVGHATGPVALDEAAELLCAALADLRSGAPAALSSLCAWLGDPARVGQHWGWAVQRFERAALTA